MEIFLSEEKFESHCFVTLFLLDVIESETLPCIRPNRFPAPDRNPTARRNHPIHCICYRHQSKHPIQMEDYTVHLS